MYVRNKIDRNKTFAKWRANNKHKIKANNVWARFGLTLSEYNRLLEAVEICQICLQKPDKKCLDHCHKSHHIRGVLCQNCNSALGFFKDSTDNLKRAINYLERGNYEQRI